MPFQVQFTILQTDSPIKINKKDGTVYVDGTIDREVTPIIKIKIIARDGGLFEDEQVGRKCIVLLALILNKIFRNFLEFISIKPNFNFFQEFQIPEGFIQNESVANLTVVVLDANDNAPTWHNYDRLRRKHSSMESEGVPMNDENENINSVIPTYTVKGKILYFTRQHEFLS